MPSRQDQAAAPGRWRFLTSLRTRHNGGAKQSIVDHPVSASAENLRAEIGIERATEILAGWRGARNGSLAGHAPCTRRPLPLSPLIRRNRAGRSEFVAGSIKRALDVAPAVAKKP
jgi:hypothetical protein